ncbi:MAG: cardiolipin synthase ClsB [Burkholderiales bacterium]|nr:cardiolipin synthase ClsB [Burkholderiales bacterium]
MAWAWGGVGRPAFVGGNRVELLQGGDELFPRMCAAIAAAEREVWLATYIFDDDRAGRAVARALSEAAERGVAVQLVVDGFGSINTLGRLRALLGAAPVRLEVFRPLDRWWAWLQPGQMRRLHQKLCAVDGRCAFVGGINILDDRHDPNHGWSEAPRLDFAIEVRGPLAAQVQVTARAMWARANLGHGWREELRSALRSAAPVDQTLDLLRRLRSRGPRPDAGASSEPVAAAFVVRDSLRQRRAIERSYIEAIRGAHTSVDIAVPYFYPGIGFRRSLRQAAGRGVRVRLLLQGKIDYRIAALAARVLYDELRAHGVRIFEYTPAFLHAKVAVVDSDWATVGSSNIDPLSLLLNLEANVVVRDQGFARALDARLEQALAVSQAVSGAPARRGWRGWLQRGFVAWCATLYLRLAGISGRY